MHSVEMGKAENINGRFMNEKLTITQRLPRVKLAVTGRDYKKQLTCSTCLRYASKRLAR
jgi:hypothetical protein